MELLTETSAINTFRFGQVEKDFLLGRQPAQTPKQVVQCSPKVTQSKQAAQCDDSVVSDIARARENIQKSLASCGGSVRVSEERIVELECKVAELEKTIKFLTNVINKLNLSESDASKVCQPVKAPAKPAAKPAAQDDDDDDVDLFGSDEDEEANAVRQKRLDEYAQKKSKKPAAVAKSSVVLDIKPWDDETDMKEMERLVRTVEMDGLVWGASKLVPLAYGIKKLQIVTVIEDDKVSVEELSEKIEAFEDFVQSVDVAAFNKI